MVIEKDKVVSVTYELKLAKGNGDIIEKVNETRPLEFLLGHGNLLPKFESNLTGLKIGDSFDFVLASHEAYGEMKEDAIVDVPKSVFVVDGQIDNDILTIGNMIPMMDNMGNRFNGKVVGVENDNVKMDFNHPLAGEDLHFKGEVVGIRDASAEELSHGHIHQASSCGCGDGCGCDSDGCDSGGCNGCN